jgi:hypothetical protein
MREQAGADGDDMDVDEGRGRVKRNSVRAGVIVARKRREGGDAGAEDGDVSGMEAGPSRAGATPYERHVSDLSFLGWDKG